MMILIHTTDTQCWRALVPPDDQDSLRSVLHFDESEMGGLERLSAVNSAEQRPATKLCIEKVS